MQGELFIPLFDILDIPNRPVEFLPFHITTLDNFFLLVGRERFVGFFCDLEFEVNWDVGAGGRGGRTIPIRGRLGLVLFLPASDNYLFETGIPGIGAVRLGRSKFSFFILIQSQIGF